MSHENVFISPKLSTVGKSVFSSGRAEATVWRVPSASGPVQYRQFEPADLSTALYEARYSYLTDWLM